MAKNLDEVKAELYEAFNGAMKMARKAPSYNDNTEEAQRLQAAAACMLAAAQTAEAITKVEREIAVRYIITDLRALGADVEVDFEKGIVRSISPMSKIKLKSPGDS
jgi:hypothetical protein